MRPARLCVALAAAALAAVPARAETLVVGVPDWPSAEVAANVIDDVLTSRFGVTVELRPGGARDLLEAVGAGTVDIHPEVWLPNLADVVAREATEGGRIRLAPRSATAAQHICATRATVAATGIAAVADLARPEMAARFDTDGDGRGELWIGDPQWASTRVEQVRAKSYGYDTTMTLLDMPEDLAMAGIDAAVATGGPIVFYCYSPHYVFALHDVVPLTEPAHDPAGWTIETGDAPDWLERSSAGSAWEHAKVQLAYGTRLAGSRPEIARFLDRVALTADEAVAFSYELDVNHRAAADVAAEWVAANEARIEEWTK